MSPDIHSRSLSHIGSAIRKLGNPPAQMPDRSRAGARTCAAASRRSRRSRPGPGVSRCRVEAVFDRLRRKARVVLLPGEPLLLRGRDDLAVADERRGAVVVVRGNPENGRHCDLFPRRCHERCVDRRCVATGSGSFFHASTISRNFGLPAAISGIAAPSVSDVFPVQRHGRRAPLLLELVGALVRRRAPEVEHVAALLERRLDDAPIQQMIRAQAVEVAHRRRPGHFDRAGRSETSAPRRSACAPSRTTCTCAARGNGASTSSNSRGE